MYMFTNWKLFLDAVMTLCCDVFHLELLVSAPWWSNDATATLFIKKKNDLKNIFSTYFALSVRQFIIMYW